MASLVYFSSISENTRRFVEKLGRNASRIPLRAQDAPLIQHDPYVLVVPTYGAGNGQGAVPKQVVKFLNDPGNRSLIRGVIAAGNTNFGSGYGIAGDIISHKCSIPVLYKFELFGTPDDVETVSQGLDAFWQNN